MGTAAVIFAAILIGSTLQRVSGTGVGLVVAPTLSILLGPVLGVLVTNMTTVVSGFLIMIAVWSRIDWRRYWLIGPAALVGAVPGALVVGALPAGWLSILLGSIVVFVLLVTVSMRTLPHVSGTPVTLCSGLIGGFFNTTSGVAAPVMVIYSRLSRWEQQRFAATLQPIFMTMGAASVLSKLATGATSAGSEVDLHLGWLAPGVVVTVLAGIAVGTWLSRRVQSSSARRLAMVLAAAGGVGAIVRGIIDVL